MSELTAEQRRRIEENRQKALKRLQEKQASPIKQPVPLAASHAVSPAKTHFGPSTSVNVPRASFLPPPPRPVLNNPAPTNIPRFPLQPPKTFPPNHTSPQKPPTVQPAARKAPVVLGNVSLMSTTRIEVDVGYNQELINLFKQIPSKGYDPTTKKWNFALDDHQKLLQLLRSMPNVQINPLPSYVINLMSKRNGANLADVESIDLSLLGDKLLNSLMPFQREGIMFGIHHNGRILLCDDMGLGKTIQAIGLSAYYFSEWPLLIVVPSSVKFVWREQLCKWLPHLSESTVQVLETAADPLQHNLRVLVVSYEMLVKRKDELTNMRFKVAVLDESHSIKGSAAARTKAALQVLKPAKRVMLLSGTPALSRPAELFTQLQAVRPDLFSSFKPFGERYCDPKPRNWGTDYSGSSNMHELQIVMEHIAMIRRIKKDVLDQLPSKMREVIVLDPAAIKSSKDFNTAADNCHEAKTDKNAFRAALMRFFHETAKIKLHAVRCYISDLLTSDKKFVVFAHHMEMLDAIEHLLNEESVGYIRIDGSVSSEERLNMIHRFARNDDCRVSLLSITAASTGIDMSVASLVIFAELFWNPGILVQAEDRCHRIGQRNCVNVQYLIAKNTSDDVVWSIIQNKLNVLSKAGLSKETFANVNVGDFTADNQSLITDYIHPSTLKATSEDDIPADMLEQLQKSQSAKTSGNDSESEASTIPYEYNEEQESYYEEDEDFMPKPSKSRRQV